MTKTRRAAVDGLFTMDETAPALLGTRCMRCGSYYFPAEKSFCRNPNCHSSELREIELGRRGTLWSFTTAGYRPPPPFVADEPFEPFVIAAVTLPDEGLTILGQVAQPADVQSLRAGMAMTLTLGKLYEDDDHVYLTWRWSVGHD